MKSLTGFSGATLAWRRGGGSPPEFQLQAGDEVVATLALLDEDGGLVRVETAEGTWTLKHLGLLTPVVTLREEGGTVNLATFHPHAFRHGKLQFLDGAVFDWTWHHGAEAGGAFLDPGGKPLVSLQTHSGRDLSTAPGLERCEVDLSPAPSAHLRQALLAAFG
jgi:hypothetical protein